MTKQTNKPQNTPKKCLFSNEHFRNKYTNKQQKPTFNSENLHDGKHFQVIRDTIVHKLNNIIYEIQEVKPKSDNTLKQFYMIKEILNATKFYEKSALKNSINEFLQNLLVIGQELVNEMTENNTENNYDYDGLNSLISEVYGKLIKLQYCKVSVPSTLKRNLVEAFEQVILNVNSVGNSFSTPTKSR